MGQASEEVQAAVAESGMTDNIRLLQMLGQIIVKVQDAVNQSLITDKRLLLQLLLQLSVKDWGKVRTSDDLWTLIQHTIITLEFMKDRIASMMSLIEFLHIKKPYELRRKVITPLLNLGYIAMTNPTKPRRANQAYRLTDKALILF